jgi:4-amino-4-deoxy-L-arabinose transferase-like glycosyltransferase
MARGRGRRLQDVQAVTGTALLLCSAGAAMVAGVALAGRWSRDASNSERTADALAVAVAVLIGVVLSLGFSGALSAGSVALGCALVGGTCGALDGRALPTRLSALAAAGLDALRRPGPLWLVAGLAAWQVARALSWPDLSWDALTYHLTYPAFWLQEGGFGRFEAGGIWDQYESFPKGGEALFFVALAPLGHDGAVGLVNLPLWLGTGAAVKGAAQRLGSSARAGSWCAAIALLSPVLSAYVTPAYVEVPSAFAFAVALSAGARAVRGADSSALVPLGLAVGLGAAVKTTGLALAPFAVLAALGCARRAAPAACLRCAAVGFGLALLVAGPWYASNAWLCDNPLYPAPLPGASEGPAAGSLASAWAIAEGSVLRQAKLGEVLAHLAAPPWQVPYPLGPGWLYLLVLPGWAVLGLAFARGERTGAVAALGGLAVALLLLYLLSPWNGVFPEANTRFLAPSCIAALLACAVALQAASRPVATALTAVAAGVALLALACSRLIRELPPAGAALVVAAVLVLATAVAVVARASPGRRRLGAALGVACAVTAALALPAALSARHDGRAAAISTHTELHPIRAHARLWARMAALPPSRVAFTVGGINFTEGWFFYPLFGSDLRHRVRYVDIEARDLRACLRRGKLREQPDERAWLARLRDGRYDYLVIDGNPLEQRWAEARPDAFTELLRDGGGRLYAIDRTRLPQSDQPARVPRL